MNNTAKEKLSKILLTKNVDSSYFLSNFDFSKLTASELHGHILSQKCSNSADLVMKLPNKGKLSKANTRKNDLIKIAYTFCNNKVILEEKATC